jgi:hypothetical protein
MALEYFFLPATCRSLNESPSLKPTSLRRQTLIFYWGKLKIANGHVFSESADTIFTLILLAPNRTGY